MLTVSKNEDSCSSLQLRNGVGHLPSARVIRPSTTSNVFSSPAFSLDKSKSVISGISGVGNSKLVDSNSSLSRFYKCGRLKTLVRRLPNATSLISSKIKPPETLPTEESLEDISDTETLLEEEIPKKYTTFGENDYVRLCRITGVTPMKCFIRQITSSTVNLSNCRMTWREIKPLAVFLMHNYIINDIDFSGNDIGSIGMLYLADIIAENVFITNLNLSKVNMQPEGFRSLMNALTKNKTLKKLNISGNSINVNFAKDLATNIRTNDYIETLDLSDNEIDDEAAKIIAPALAANLTIRKLSLRWNHIRLEGASEIAKAITENIELKEVDLSWNGLSEDGCKVFGNYLPKNHSLQVLDLSHNRICFKSLAFLLKGLSGNDGLTTLRLHGNPLTTDGAIALLKTVESSVVSKIEELDIRDIPVNEEFMKSLDQLAGKKPVLVLHRQPTTYGLRHNVNERELIHFDPLVLLFEYMKQENMRLFDLFRAFDTDQDARITKSELKEGFKSIGIHLTDSEIGELAKKLDLNDNSVIEYEEFKRARAQNARKHRAGGDRYKAMINDIKFKLTKNKNEKLNSAKTREKEKRERERGKLMSDEHRPITTASNGQSEANTTSKMGRYGLLQQELNAKYYAESDMFEFEGCRENDQGISINNTFRMTKFVNLIRRINKIKNSTCNENLIITNE